MSAGNKCFIGVRFPSLNEYVNECRRSPYNGAKEKRSYERAAGWYIRLAMQQGKLRPVKGPCIVQFIWQEPNRKRDVDNIQFGQKFVLDALVRNGVLENDSQKYVVNTTHTAWVVDDKNMVGVKIIIEEAVE